MHGERGTKAAGITAFMEVTLKSADTYDSGLGKHGAT